MFWLKLYRENVFLCNLIYPQITLAEKEATHKHFKHSVEKTGTSGNISQPPPVASAPFFPTSLRKPFTRCHFSTLIISNYNRNIFPESSQNNYSNKMLCHNLKFFYLCWNVCNLKKKNQLLSYTNFFIVRLTLINRGYLDVGSKAITNFLFIQGFLSFNLFIVEKS